MAVQRIERAGQIGFQVRVDGRGRPGYTRYFAAARHGGETSAHELAKAAERGLRIQYVMEHGAAGSLQSNNRSGVAGIRFQWRPTRDGEWQYLYATGNYTVRGRMHCFGYSLERHGIDGALRLAIAKRGLVAAEAKAALARLREYHSEVR